MRAFWGVIIASLLLVACGGDDGSNDEGQAPDAGAAGAPYEPDDFCPDPDNPRVHYLDQDASACQDVELQCSAEQYGFQNSCGCGCIDKGDPLCPEVTDPAITWHSQDPAECGAEAPECPLGEVGFSNTCGCGCLQR
jgi:hypothetical protein